MSSLFSRAGLTLHGGDFKAMSLKFVPLKFVVINTVRMWPSTAFAKALVDAIRSNMTDHVVHFALFYLLLIWYICSMGYIISVTFTKPGGYPNRAPRAYTAEGAIYRTKCSAENTFESMVCFLIAVAIYEKAANDYAQELIASWAVLVMLARTMYPGESCLCTSFFASSFISFYGKTLSVFILIITDFIILP
eukprot:scaffold20957_cov144-Skeletonema_menzelii.AAC.7